MSREARTRVWSGKLISDFAPLAVYNDASAHASYNPPPPASSVSSVHGPVSDITNLIALPAVTALAIYTLIQLERAYAFTSCIDGRPHHLAPVGPHLHSTCACATWWRWRGRRWWRELHGIGLNRPVNGLWLPCDYLLLYLQVQLRELQPAHLHGRFKCKQFLSLSFSRFC